MPPSLQPPSEPTDDPSVASHRSQAGGISRPGFHADTAPRSLALSAFWDNEERFQLLVNSIKDYAIFMLDPQGYIVTWNEGARRIKGYRQDEIVGKHFSVFYPAEDVAGDKPVHNLDIVRREGRYEAEGWRVRKDGSRFWANVVITALHDEQGELVGFAKVTRDLTDRRRAEEERAARLAAEKATRLRDEFLSIAAHELKTPITSLRLQIQLAERRLVQSGSTTPEEIQHTFKSIDAQTQKLATLVTQLLDISRIEEGKLRLEYATVDVGRLVADRVAISQSRAPRRKVSLDVSGDVRARVDSLRLEQVLSNLLENAVKYTPDGSPIAVAVSQPSSEELEIVVRDWGPGIPEAARSHLFRRFFQGVGRRRTHVDGMGLGLYISQQIIAQHEGMLSAEFPSEGGCRFVIRLPRRLADTGDE